MNIICPVLVLVPVQALAPQPVFPEPVQELVPEPEPEPVSAPQPFCSQQ